MGLFALTALFIIWAVSNVKPEILPENFEETYPTLRLKSYRLFAKNRTVAQNNTHFRIPRVFDELMFECTSTLPFKWNYFAEQLKTIEIKKWRLYNNSGGNGTVGRLFYSTFRVALSNPNRMINLSCENVCPTILNNCTYLNAFLQNTVSEHVPAGFFEVEYGYGNRASRRAAQDRIRGVNVIARLGWNHGCKYQLNVDLETGTFACMQADGSGEEVPSMFIPCNNPDECDTVFNYNGDKCASGTTFKPNCTSAICSELRDTRTLFVLACGEFNENSIARGYYRTLDDVHSGRKQLHEYRRKRVPYEDMMEIRLQSNESKEMKYAKNKSVIYSKYTRDFECIALSSFFSHGFLWSLILSNGKEINIGTGTETTNDDDQLYISRKRIRFNSPLITSIICEAPNWNELNGTNYTMHVTVTESIPPYFNKSEGKNVTMVKEKIVDVNVSSTPMSLICTRSGQPPAMIEWRFDGIKPEASHGNATVVQHYTLLNQSEYKSEVIMEPNHPFREVVCIVSNNAGKARLHYRFKRDNAIGARMDVPVMVSVVLFAIFLVLVVIASAVYKIRKTQQGAYLSDGDIEEFFTGASGGHDAFVLPYDKKLEVSRESFTTDDVVLGSGTYGKVIKGHIGFLDVAIKVSKSSGESLDYLKALLSEVKVMSYVGSHPNIVNLIGACTSNLQKNEIQVILEFCERGDMLSVLKKGRSKFINLFETSSVGPSLKSPIVSELVSSNMILSTRHLIDWALDIVDAMEFISSKNIIHGDLAARNVLISHDLKAKISDFGLSKHMYSCAVYVKKSYVPLPTRWMAYESLKNLEFSKESDVWSLGVTLWEMFSLGEIPYDKYMWEFQSHALLAEGIRLEKPAYASEEIYTLMNQTWNIVATERPSYVRLKEVLNRIFNNLQD